MTGEPSTTAVRARRTTLTLGPAGLVVLPVFLLGSILGWAAGGVAMLFSALGLAVWGVALFHALRQGRGLRLLAHPAAPHWSGEAFLFDLELQGSRANATHRDLLICRGAQPGERARFGQERPVGTLPQLVGCESIVIPCGHRHLQRGREKELHLGVSSSFPFGLLRVERHFVLPVDMMSWPRLGSWRGTTRHVPRRLERLERPSPQAGNDEFRQLSAWRHGMSPRGIHWKQSERRGLWLVQELEGSSANAVELELLTTVGSAQRGRENQQPSFETAVSLVATLLEYHLRQGASVKLRITGSDASASHTFRGRTGRVAALDLLAEVQATQGTPQQLEEQVAGALQRGATQVVFAGGLGLRGPRQVRTRSTQLLDVDAPDLDRHFRRARDSARGEREASREVAG